MAAFSPGARLSSTSVVLPEPNAPQREQLALRGLGSQALRFARQERPNAGSSVCFNGRDAALGNHLAAARTGLRPHLNQPIGFG